MNAVIPLVAGIALFASLMLLLFAFAHLRDREQSRSLMAPRAAETRSPSQASARNAEPHQVSPFSSRMGEHYVSGSMPGGGPGAVTPPPVNPDATGRVPAITGSRDPRPGVTPGAGGGLTITGFDSAGSKVFLAIEYKAIADKRWGVTIGRDGTLSDFEVRDRDNYVSRRHFRILWNSTDRSYEIEDLASTSGTILDGRQLEPFRMGPIRPGSTLRIGKLELDVGRV